MRLFPALLLAFTALGATNTDQQIDDLARRLRNLTAKESPACQADTLLRAAALLGPGRPDLAAVFRDAGLTVLRGHPELEPKQPAGARPLPSMLRELEREPAGDDAIARKLAEFLKTVEHGEERPEDYAAIAEIAARHHLSIGGDNASVRARWVLAEMSGLLDTSYDVTLATLDHAAIQLAKQRGMVVVLSFWATWCQPCRDEMPALERLYRAHASELTILAVSDEDPELIRAFVKQTGITFPVVLDAQRKTFDHFKVDGLPATRVLDATGRLRVELNGASEVSLEPHLAGLLKY